MTCAANQVGDPFSYCLPGSQTPCTVTGVGADASAASGTCPAGEACALGLNPAATQPGPGAYAGACMTTLIAGKYMPVGSVCDEGAGPYECANAGGYLGDGCFARRCTRGCRLNSECPVGMACGPPPFSSVEGGAVSAMPPSGICLGRFCGEVRSQADLLPGQVTRQGADKLCPTGEICAPTLARGATGDILYLSCVPPLPGARAFGQPCSPDPAAGMRCADDALCVERGGTRFCGMLCRADADCPSGSFCIDDYRSAPLPNGTTALLGLCTPEALVPGKVCTSERDCAGGMQQACKPAGGRTNRMLCQNAVGPKTVGMACAAGTECVSGECFDRDLNPPSGANRTSCTAYCRKNSDCGQEQICYRLVWNSTTTPEDPGDDTVHGYCRPLATPPRQGCTMDSDCATRTAVDEIGGDACDVALGTCYTRGARIGSACMYRADCPIGAYCQLRDPRFESGACLSYGCDPASTNAADACPAGSVCKRRGTDTPLYSCYESCPADLVCPRLAEGYVCQAIIAGDMPDVCASEPGT
jgi:hypothetical protein